jgi:hypothetical protein
MTDVWDLWKKHFAIGDDILAIDWWDEFHWGTITAYDDRGVTLRRPNGKTNWLAWDGVTMVCHDGLPVRLLRGFSSSVIEQLETNFSKLDLFRVLDEYQDTEDELEERRKRFSVRRGDPYELDWPISRFQLCNRGSRGINTPTEETLVVDYRGGGHGHLYFLQDVFEIEIVIG